MSALYFQQQRGFLVVINFRLIFFLFPSNSGGGNSSGGNNPTMMTGDGTVYYPNASEVKVCVDEKLTGNPDDNHQCTAATKASDGVWSYKVGEYGKEYPIVAGITVASQSASFVERAEAVVKYSNYLSAPAGKNEVSIITTYVKSAMEVQGVTIEAATASVKKELKLTGDPLAKPSDADSKKINIIAQSAEKALAEAFGKLGIFDAAKIMGLISVIADSVTAIIDEIENAVASGGAAPAPKLPYDLQGSIDTANDAANANKFTVMPIALQNAKHFKMPNGKIYVVNGSAKNTLGNTEEVSSVFVLDPKTKKWETISSISLNDKCSQRDDSRFDFSVLGDNIIANCNNTNNDNERNRVYFFNTADTAPKWMERHIERTSVSGSNQWCDTLVFNGIMHRVYDNGPLFKLDFTKETLKRVQLSNDINDYAKMCNYNMLYVTATGKIYFGYSDTGVYNIFDTNMSEFSTISGKTIMPKNITEADFANIILINTSLENTGYVFSLKDDKFSEYVTLDLTTLEWSSVKTAGGDVPSKEMVVVDTRYGVPDRSLFDGKFYLFGAYGDATSNFSDKVCVL